MDCIPHVSSCMLEVRHWLCSIASAYSFWGAVLQCSNELSGRMPHIVAQKPYARVADGTDVTSVSSVEMNGGIHTGCTEATIIAHKC